MKAVPTINKRSSKIAQDGLNRSMGRESWGELSDNENSTDKLFGVNHRSASQFDVFNRGYNQAYAKEKRMEKLKTAYQENDPEEILLK